MTQKKREKKHETTESSLQREWSNIEKNRGRRRGDRSGLVARLKVAGGNRATLKSARAHRDPCKSFLLVISQPLSRGRTLLMVKVLHRREYAWGTHTDTSVHRAAELLGRALESEFHFRGTSTARYKKCRVFPMQNLKVSRLLYYLATHPIKFYCWW